MIRINFQTTHALIWLNDEMSASSFLVGASGFLVCFGLYLLFSLGSKPRKSVHVGRLRSVVIRKPVIVTMGYAGRIVSLSPFQESSVATIKIEQTDFNLPLEEINANLEGLDTKRAYWAEIYKMRTGTRYLTPATVKAKEAKEKADAQAAAAPTLPGMGDVKTATEPVAASGDVAKPAEPEDVKEAEPEAVPSIPIDSAEKKPERHEQRKHKQA